MSYSVQIESTEHTFQVDEGESVLDAALRQNIALPYGCRGGACGACKGKVLKGNLSYPNGLPDGISEEDHSKGYALFCVGVPSSDLIINSREIMATSDIQVKTLPCRVHEKTQLNHDVVLIKLILPKTERLQFFAHLPWRCALSGFYQPDVWGCRIGVRKDRLGQISQNRSDLDRIFRRNYYLAGSQIHT